MVDITTEWGQHAEQRLRSNIIAWLTTVGSDGRPYTSPIWFLWDGKAVLIFSQPNKQKLRNLHKNARVTLALDDTQEGDDVVIIEGTAELELDRKSTPLNSSHQIISYADLSLIEKTAASNLDHPPIQLYP